MEKVQSPSGGLLVNDFSRGIFNDLKLLEEIDLQYQFLSHQRYNASIGKGPNFCIILKISFQFSSLSLILLRRNACLEASTEIIHCWFS